MFPETGRQHQLRVHLSHLGHPIVGDKLYGPEGVSVFMEAIDDGMSDALLGRLGHHRQALHAETLGMPHPMDGSPLRLLAPVAEDMQELWGRLGGHGEVFQSSRSEA
jgi:23S rRNA pseudouridine1911/1915/1917 synthase